MLKIRVIPTLLWSNFGLVKGAQFDSWRRVGPVMPAIKVYNQRDVDELILVDITKNLSKEPLDLELINDYSKECFVPFTVGGGISKIEDVQELLTNGADKVCINSAAYDDPELITKIANRHGAQCIVASIDVRKDALKDNWICFKNSGKFLTDKYATEWAKELEDRGAGEILLTSIERDGTYQGYDLDLIERVASVVKIPVIASGGAGSYDHMIQAVKNGGASAVAAASIFHFTEMTPAGAKLAMKAAGISVRNTM
jgi:cyclase